MLRRGFVVGPNSGIYSGADRSGIPSTSASTVEGSGDDSDADGTETDAGTGTDTGTGTDDGTTKLDVVPEDTGDTAIDEGCGKIDFLFVIDNSASMLGEQESLIQSFPGFISEIVDVTGARTSTSW
jgi:hypothetical protein